MRRLLILALAAFCFITSAHGAPSLYDIRDISVVSLDTSGGASAYTLPTIPGYQQAILVKDVTGNARANPVTISGAVNIDGTASVSLNQNYQALIFFFNGATWNSFTPNPLALLAFNNLSDVASVATSRTNLGLDKTANAFLTGGGAGAAYNAVPLTGLVKGNGASAPTAGVSGTDYAPATSGSAIQLGNGAGGFSAYAGVSGQSHKWISALSSAGAGTQTQPACGDLSNGAASCSTDTTNASNISSGTLPAARLPTRATSQAQPADPAGTTSTAACKMMGLAGTITPATTGTVFFNLISGYSTSLATDGAAVNLRYGTGSAPVNGDAATGTQIGAQEGTSIITANLSLIWPVGGVATGLSVGTPYWIDACLTALIGGTASMTNPSLSALELN